MLQHVYSMNRSRKSLLIFFQFQIVQVLKKKKKPLQPHPIQHMFKQAKCAIFKHIS